MSARSGIQVCSELNSGSINTVYVYSSVLWIKYKYTISTLHFAVAAYFAIHKKKMLSASRFSFVLIYMRRLSVNLSSFWEDYIQQSSKLEHN